MRRLLALALVVCALMPGASLRAQPRPLEIESATITELQAAIDAGTLSSEALVRHYLARITAYDGAGPAIHAVLALNPRAIDEARALDAERKAKGRRSPLHGMPIVLKDNFDTQQLPTTAGSVLLKGYQPAADATVVKQLRAAGAIVLAKVNMSEFASGNAFSSLGGQTRNPHNVLYSPNGSSGGTGASIAAAFAQLGLGTDTGGSIRGPATFNGVVALKPTRGLVSRNGIVPLALTFDTGGPFARSVTDLAIALGAMTGVDATDSATLASANHALTNYTSHLKSDGLKDARIGIARDFTGYDADVDFVVEASLDAMRRAGATVVEVRIPKWVLDAKDAWYRAVRYPEFPVQIAAYLKATPVGYPKTLAEMIERTRSLPSLGADGSGPNAVRWNRFVAELGSGSMQDLRYTTVHDQALPLLRTLVNGLLREQQLDAIVYPTSPVKPNLIGQDDTGNAPDPMNIANLTGFPDLIVPAGFTESRLPVGLSFLGSAWSEPRLIELAYSFEQATRARRLPVTTPAIPMARSRR